MSSAERFALIQELFHTARKLPPAQRRDFLSDRCRQNDSLKQEIESLLAGDTQSSDSSVDSAPAPLSGISRGTRIGHYEVISLLGMGGMGQVYRAHDSILHRDIALKVLPPSFAIDVGRQSRLMREAQVLASLSHPNIAVIHGVEHSTGTLAFAMEIVPGETLAERIAAGPIPLREALRIARQIADALEAAHERGIVHRDLKPANIKITPEGTVKVLDFGLAKDLSIEGMQSSEAAEPLPLTHDGMILGTAAYVSPEQARGLSTDRRTDIWAFGVVLFEMLTGTRPFRGHTNADVLAAVIKEEPDLGAIPPAVRDVIARCLSKDLRHRWAGIGDVRWALDQSLAARPQDSAAVTHLAALPALGCCLLRSGGLRCPVVQAAAARAGPATRNHSARGNDAWTRRSRAIVAFSRRKPVGISCYRDRWEAKTVASFARFECGRASCRNRECCPLSLLVTR